MILCASWVYFRTHCSSFLLPKTWCSLANLNPRVTEMWILETPPARFLSTSSLVSNCSLAGELLYRYKTISWTRNFCHWFFLTSVPWRAQSLPELGQDVEVPIRCVFFAGCMLYATRCWESGYSCKAAGCGQGGGITRAAARGIQSLLWERDCERRWRPGPVLRLCAMRHRHNSHQTVSSLAQRRYAVYLRPSFTEIDINCNPL